ncbi:hypothetical protein JCGZ_24385 [Jatropha curcas]|uniref:Uncharacterized protein n=1 Tax=Jatropha curcas TaxID=180498 RepID=A0A067L2B0_JATCU|nr:hypothetical protein JCGZ_24385 [Jatropha curcas]
MPLAVVEESCWRGGGGVVFYAVTERWGEEGERNKQLVQRGGKNSPGSDAIVERGVAAAMGRGVIATRGRGVAATRDRGASALRGRGASSLRGRGPSGLRGREASGLRGRGHPIS